LKLISVSRRTDIPAFYSEWFMNRIRDGYVRWINPFSGRVHRISLRPEDVTAFVFWSKNYISLLSHLDELDAQGYRMVFHFTITGLPKVFEPCVPEASQLVECARTLAGRCGADAVLWRYDPVLISSVTDKHYHLSRFRELCEALEGSVKRCYFSFTVFYPKVNRNFEALRQETDIVCQDLPISDRVEIAYSLADIASEHGIEMLSCCGDYLVDNKIKRAHCTDAELIHRLYPDRARRLVEAPTREGCGCCECTDIGSYDTCPHGCVYCYANSRAQTAMRSYQRHDPLSDMLGRYVSPRAEEVGAAQRKPAGTEELTLGL
jgi:DNA repair photolyase